MKTYKIYSIVVMLLIPLVLNAGYMITGKVIVANDDNPVFSVIVTPSDTVTKPISATFNDEVFQIPMDTAYYKGTLEISVMGYSTFSSPIKLNAANLDLGTITISDRNLELKEVTVKGKRIHIERDGLNFTISNIQGTHLGEAGNLMDMLKWTPGVIVKMGENISVMGKGTPEIYINDRKIMSQSELFGIQSSEVKRIEVVREPTVKSAISSNAAIMIYLKKPLKDYAGASLTNSTDFFSRVSNSSSLNLNGKYGILSASASFSYSYRNGKAFDYSGTTITHSSDNIFSNNSDGYFTYLSNRYNIFGGINLNFNPKSIFTLQYSGVISDDKLSTNHSQNINDNNNEYSKHNISNNNSDKDRHSVSMSYALTRNANSKLMLVADYATNNTNNIGNILERNLNTLNENMTHINSMSKYNIYTFNSDYTFKIGKEDDEKIGVSGSYISNKNDMVRNEVPQIMSRDNFNGAAYANFHRWWGKFNVSVGLRYEYDRTVTKLNEDGKITDLTKEYSNLFPNVRVAFMPRKGNIYAINYRRTFGVPQFSQLSPIVVYEDSLHYSVGNPLLKPVFRDRVGLTFNCLKDFTFAASYSYLKNQIVEMDYQDAQNSNIIVNKPNNIHSSHAWDISVDYMLSLDKISLSVYGILESSHIKIPYLGKLESHTNVGVYLSTNFSYRFLENYEIYTQINYQSPWRYGAKSIGYSMGIDMGVSAKFFKKRLYVSLDMNDILRKSVTPWWENKANNTYTWRKNEYDTRGVTLRLRYTFNSINVKFTKKSGNDKMLQRSND